MLLYVVEVSRASLTGLKKKNVPLKKTSVLRLMEPARENVHPETVRNLVSLGQCASFLRIL